MQQAKATQVHRRVASASRWPALGRRRARRAASVALPYDATPTRSMGFLESLRAFVLQHADLRATPGGYLRGEK
jgi:hypothetical protein